MNDQRHQMFWMSLEYFESVTIIFKGLVESRLRNRNCLEYNNFPLHKCSYDNTLEHLRKTKKNR